MTKKKEKLVIRKKEFRYYGYTLEELQKMSYDELANVLNTRCRRVLKRGFTEEQYKFIEKLKYTSADKIIKTHHRDMIILPQFVGRKISIHNGKDFKVIEIMPEMIGHYLGEFSLTRYFVKHSGPGIGATRSSKFLPLK